MLVLTRKSHEAVVVGDRHHLDQLLKVTVLGVKGDKVRLGFEVDKNVPINRWEVWQRICSGAIGWSGNDAQDPSSGQVLAAR
jgi:carbon storage regulator